MMTLLNFDNKERKNKTLKFKKIIKKKKSMDVTRFSVGSCKHRH